MAYYTVPAWIVAVYLALPSAHVQSQQLPGYPALRASVPGTGYAEELQRLDEGLSAVLNADIDFGRPPAIAIDYRESPIASLLQQANAPLPPVEIDIAPDSLLKNVARQLLGQPVNCDHEVLPLPASINEAMDQIARLSQLTQSAFTELRSSRSANRLRRYYADAVTTLNDHPFGGDLTRRESIDLRRFLQVLDQVDLEASVCASLSWSRLGDPQWLDQLQRLLETHALAQHDIIAEQATEFGSIILSGSSSSTLQRENVLFLADLGGNDIYGLESTTRFSGLPQLIVDFSGNDRYESAYHGSIASGLGSVSILIDREGDDWYGSTSLSQGAAIMGVGLLLDISGDDRYQAHSMSQGFGLYGIGLLVDGDGSDNYHVRALGQGVGMASGFGMLTDYHGADEYIAGGAIPTNYGTPGLSDAWAQGVGLGIRDLARGGTGRLLDGGGRDQFDSGSFSQGGGYYLGFGDFVNLGNDADTYLGSRYNFGWGAHGGIGHFYEAGGNDYYRTRQIVAAGLAWDRSLALFQDAGGDDQYDMGDFSLGASALGSAAVFLDRQGEDQYRGVTPARANQEPPNLSLFFDLGSEQNTLNGQLLEKNCRYRESLSVTFAVDSVEEARFEFCTPAND